MDIFDYHYLCASRSSKPGAMKTNFHLLTAILFSLAMLISCQEDNDDPDGNPVMDRFARLPSDIQKQGPETDDYPPILYSTDYELPVPLGSGINSSGAEDSPFVLPDGNTLYFFFTPDVRVPADHQLLDSVTGVWVSKKVNNEWDTAIRVWLQDPGKLALDGAVTVQDNEMWFASAREGYDGVNMFTAEMLDGQWKNWIYSGDRLMKEIQIGEVHLLGDVLFFHSGRSGGLGGYDIWTTTRTGESWSDPVHLSSVNTAETEGWPYVSSDGNELWFTRYYLGTPAIYKSEKAGNDWGEPELVLSQFAGEPTLDDAGNLYFVHHYYKNNLMIEADIYVASRK